MRDPFPGVDDMCPVCRKCQVLFMERRVRFARQHVGTEESYVHVRVPCQSPECREKRGAA